MATKDTKQQSEKIPGEIHRVFARNATEETYLQIRAERVGTTFQQDLFTYRVADVIRDDLKRVILVGQLASI
jgi:hypothetical protein